MKRRVVVTGLGAVTPIGNNVDEFWKSVKEGKCGIGPITRFDTSEYKVHLAAEVKDFNAKDYLDFKTAKRMGRFSHYAIAASREAFADAGLDMANEDPYRVGVIIGSGIGDLETSEAAEAKIQAGKPSKVNPFTVPMMIANMAAGNVAIDLGAKGKCTSVVTACASSTHSIGDAFRAIQYGDADVCVAGGAEGSICPLGVASFTSLTALSDSEDPARASIPFDKDRHGFVMGEGAGIVILEELEHAKARNAKIYAELVGYGATCDAHHITAPIEDGSGAAKAMELAMNEAGIQPSDVTYINAHGTGTPMNDKLETLAIKNALGEARAREALISSTKSMTGHMLGAAGGVEAIASVMALEEGVLPPTIHLDEPDPECDLNYLPHTALRAQAEMAVSLSLGFGGHNAAIAIRRI